MNEEKFEQLWQITKTLLKDDSGEVVRVTRRMLLPVLCHLAVDDEKAE